VYNRHQEFTELTIVYFSSFFDPACIGGRPLFVRVDHAPRPFIRDRPLMEYRPLLEDLRYIYMVHQCYPEDAC